MCRSALRFSQDFLFFFYRVIWRIDTERELISSFIFLGRLSYVWFLVIL